MPPLPLLPNQPLGTPDWYSVSGYGPSSTAPQAASGSSDTERWDAYIATIKQAMAAAAGWEREKLRRQYEDAVKGRENAYRIAELSAQTSRYSTDAQTASELRRLKEDQRQFDANHGLEQQKFGLDVVKTGVDYLSTPDRAFMFGDFNEGMARIGMGSSPTPYGTGAQPHTKTWEDFAALSGFGNLPAVQNGQSAQMTAQQGGGPAAPGSGSDPRVKAAMGILKAIPPSDGAGHDEDNWAALGAIENVFRASKPGSLERMRPGQQKMFAAGLSRLGYYAPDAIEQMRRNNPHQGSVRSA